MTCVRAREKTKMRSGKDEEKHLDPLFPRIHINDAEKGGGPRAPPRNKMALCEQLTIPCNRFTSGSLSMLPLPPSTTTTTSTSTSTGLARSASSSNHVSCHKKSMFSPFCSSPGSSDLAVRPHPRASVGVNFNTVLTNREPRRVAPLIYPTSSTTHHLPGTTENNPFQQHNFLSTTNFIAERIREQDHLRGSTFAHSPRSIPHANARENIENYKHTFSCSNSPSKLQIACEKQLKESGRGLSTIEFAGKRGNCKVSPQSSERHGKRLDPVLSTKEKIVIDANLCQLAIANNVEPDAGAHVVNYMRRQAEGISKVSQTSDNLKRPVSVISTKEKIFKDAASSSPPQNRNAKPDTYTVVSVSQKRSSLLDNASRLRDPSAQSHQDCKILQESNAIRDGINGNLETFTRKRSTSAIESKLCSSQRVEDEHRSPSRPASVNECSKDPDCVSVRVGIIDRSDGTSDTSVVESVAGAVVSPDDVVEILGQKHFWKARRTIVDQQRIFAVQIFELHRLLKVQRLMAESPEMLFEGSFYLGKSSIKFPPMKKLIAENIRDPSPLLVQAKADPQKPNLSLEGTAENAYGKPSPVDNDTQKGANSQHSTPTPCPQALTSLPTAAADIKFAPLLFHPPPGNQWLIPVRSPSEGLIYKPYTGPCPPTAGFLTPVYGSPGPISLPGGAGNFLNTAYCLPASNQQGIGNYPSHAALGQSFIQPYPMPVTNATGSSSTVERISAFSKPQPVEQDLISPPTTNTVTPYQNSCNIPSQKSWIVPDYGGKHIQVSKESDQQGSTASSPPERNNGDALSLFPTTPSTHVSDQPARSSSPEQRIQVIKVVPHSRKSACESAARIFRTIQEERKRHD